MLVMLALAMKLLIPAGFMPTQNEGHLVVSLCSGMEGMTSVIAIPMHENDKGKSGPAEQAKSCLFAGHSAPSLAAVDPVLLMAALLLAIIFAQHWVAPVEALASPRLRPPLRAPPLPV